MLLFFSLSFSSSLHIIRIHSPLIRMQISVCICVCVENLTLENISIWFEEMHGPFFLLVLLLLASWLQASTKYAFCARNGVFPCIFHIVLGENKLRF